MEACPSSWFWYILRIILQDITVKHLSLSMDTVELLDAGEFAEGVRTGLILNTSLETLGREHILLVSGLPPLLSILAFFFSFRLAAKDHRLSTTLVGAEEVALNHVLPEVRPIIQIWTLLCLAVVQNTRLSSTLASVAYRFCPAQKFAGVLEDVGTCDEHALVKTALLWLRFGMFHSQCVVMELILLR